VKAAHVWPTNEFEHPQKLHGATSRFVAMTAAIGAAVCWVFFKRRFLLGFFAGWSYALLLNAGYVMAVFQHKCLFGYCIQGVRKTPRVLKFLT
jgi:hypothetical protein